MLSDAQAADGGAKLRKQTLWLLESGRVPVTRAAFPEKQYYKQRVIEGFGAWKWKKAAVVRFSLWKDCARRSVEETWRRHGERGWGKVGNRGAPQPLRHLGDGTLNQAAAVVVETRTQTEATAQGSIPAQRGASDIVPVVWGLPKKGKYLFDVSHR